MVLFGLLGLATVWLGGARHHGWEIGPTGLHDLSPLLFCFWLLFGVDGQLAQVPRMGLYFGRCSCWVYGIVGRACEMSLVLLTPLPSLACHLYLDYCLGGVCALAVGRDVCFGFPLWWRGCVAMFCWQVVIYFILYSWTVGFPPLPCGFGLGLACLLVCSFGISLRGRDADLLRGKRLSPYQRVYGLGLMRWLRCGLLIFLFFWPYTVGGYGVGTCL